MRNTKRADVNIGFLSLLGLLFIGLKLTGHIAWSWWWVLCPFWAVPALLLAVVGIVFLVSVAVEIFTPSRKR